MRDVINIKQINIILFLFLIICIFSIVKTFSLEINIGDKTEVVSCELSEEYIKWEKLSEEEKINIFMPPMCKSNIKFKPTTFLLRNTNNELPNVFDGRLENYTTTVKDQMDTNSCWAFSSITALEYLNNKINNSNLSFSTRHLSYSSIRNFLNDEINIYGYNKTLNVGGTFYMSSNYFINSRGPILESDMSFENNENLIDINDIKNKETKLDVNDIVLNVGSGASCTDMEIQDIKKYIYEYGSVAITTYISGDYKYYNSDTSSYYYNGDEIYNHAVIVIGWDDNYSRDNFSNVNKPNSDGAWIVQNSYGTSFGDDGYYYISYEDVNVCQFYMVVRDIDNEVEDNAYIYDNLGYNVFYGFKTGNTYHKSAYTMNVFTKELNKKEELKEVTFGSNGTGYYEIYFTEGNGKNTSVIDMELIGEGFLEHSGYVTHKLETPILLDNNITNFSIVIYYNMDVVTNPIPVSAATSSFYQYVDTSSDKSFISSNGDNWQDLNTVDSGKLIASIKAFTDDVDVPITSDVYEIDEKNLLIYVEPNTSQSTFISNIKGISNKESFIGYTENVYTGLNVDEYTIVVLGDVNGDGFAKMNDVMMISKYIVEGNGLIDYYKLAADVNFDSSIKMNDVMMISKYIVEGGSL